MVLSPYWVRIASALLSCVPMVVGVFIDIVAMVLSPFLLDVALTVDEVLILSVVSVNYVVFILLLYVTNSHHFAIEYLEVYFLLGAAGLYYDRVGFSRFHTACFIWLLSLFLYYKGTKKY